MKWMQTNLKKEQKHQRIEQALKINLKKRKVFQDKIKKECNEKTSFRKYLKFRVKSHQFEKKDLSILITIRDLVPEFHYK